MQSEKSGKIDACPDFVGEQARSWGCQALRSLLGWMTRARRGARKATSAKHLLQCLRAAGSAGGRQHPGCCAPSALPAHLLFVKKVAPAVVNVQMHTQGGCRTRGRRMFPSSCERSTHTAAGVTHSSGSTWAALPKRPGELGLPSSRVFPGMRSKGPRATREAMASSFLDPRKRGVHTSQELYPAVGGGRPTWA